MASRTSGHASARDLVRRIAKGHGHLGEETLQRMDPETRREVEEALLKKDELIGSTVIAYVQHTLPAWTLVAWTE